MNWVNRTEEDQTLQNLNINSLKKSEDGIPDEKNRRERLLAQAGGDELRIFRNSVVPLPDLALQTRKCIQVPRVHGPVSERSTAITLHDFDLPSSFEQLHWKLGRRLCHASD